MASITRNDDSTRTARSLKAALAGIGLPITHCQALDVVARMAGDRSQPIAAGKRTRRDAGALRAPTPDEARQFLAVAEWYTRLAEAQLVERNENVHNPIMLQTIGEDMPTPNFGRKLAAWSATIPWDAKQPTPTMRDVANAMAGLEIVVNGLARTISKETAETLALIHEGLAVSAGITEHYGADADSDTSIRATLPVRPQVPQTHAETRCTFVRD